MKTPWVPLVALAAVLALGCLATRADELADQQAEKEAQAFNSRLRSDFQLPKVFDFQRFKDNFGKHYSSALEEMVRAKLFMARMYRAFISAVKYKYRAAKYFLSVNSRTDRTPDELDEERNHQIAQDAASWQNVKEPTIAEKPAKEDETVEPLVDPADVADELRRIHEQRDEPGYRELDAELAKIQAGASSRPKREAAARRRAPRADFDLSATYDRQKVVDRGTLAVTSLSNNPNYEEPEFHSQMSIDEVPNLPGGRYVYAVEITYTSKPRNYANFLVKGDYTTKAKPFLASLTQDFVFGAKRMWTSLNKSKRAENERSGGQGGTGHGEDGSGSDSEYEVYEWEEDSTDEDESDWVGVDHRQGGCLQPVQDQGACGSCWAFATIAFLEWAHCQETGSPLKFSEQYLLDCSSHIDGLKGCNGGHEDMVSVFVHNYGLELARHYPYSARQDQCPYDNIKEPLKMGYIRVDSPEIVKIPLEAVEQYLVNMPLIAKVSSKGDYLWYGGGIYDGLHCEQQGDHAALLVGHGREDGEEYWLIRNSYSTDYGEQGYMRLNKNTGCIKPPLLAFGRLTGRQIRVHTQRNWRVPKPVQRRPKVAVGEEGQRKAEQQAIQREMELQRRREEARRKRTNIV